MFQPNNYHYPKKPDYKSYLNLVVSLLPMMVQSQLPQVVLGEVEVQLIGLQVYNLKSSFEKSGHRPRASAFSRALSFKSVWIEFANGWESRQSILDITMLTITFWKGRESWGILLKRFLRILVERNIIVDIVAWVADRVISKDLRYHGYQMLFGLEPK